MIHWKQFSWRKGVPLIVVIEPRSIRVLSENHGRSLIPMCQSKKKFVREGRDRGVSLHIKGYLQR